jgi:hypothetical protein
MESVPVMSTNAEWAQPAIQMGMSIPCEVPDLSPDGEVLFPLRDRIRWVDTSFVEDLKPERFR